MSKNPNISIGFSQNKFAQETNKMATELKNVKKEFEITNLSIQATGDSLKLAENKIRGYGEEVKILKAATSSMNKGLEDSISVQSKLAARTQAAKQSLESAEKNYGKNSEQVEKLKQEYEELVQKLGKAENKVSLWRGKLQDVQIAEGKLKVAIAQTNAEIEKQNKGLAENIKNTQNVTTSTGKLLDLYTLIKGLAIGYAGKTLFDALIGGNAQFEQYMASFEVLLGGADKAQKRMDELTVFAAKTPFELPQVVEAEKRLLAYGVASKDTAKVMQMLGDISMGNAEKLNMVSLAYGQVVTNQKLYGTELRQFAENGVPLLEELASMYGVTAAEMRKMVEDGQISADAVTAALGRMTSEGGKFFGMMEKQSQTMQGMWSTLKDSFNMFARDVGEESFNYLKDELDSFKDTLDDMSKSGELGSLAKEWGRDIASFTMFIVDAVKILYDLRGAVIAVGAAFAITSVVNGAVSAFQALSATVKVLPMLFKSAKIESDLLNASLIKTPWGIVAAVIGLVAGSLITYAMNTKEAYDETDKLVEKTSELTEEYKRNIDTINKQTNSQLGEMVIAKKLADELNTLRQNTNKSASEKARMAEIVDQLNGKLPNLVLAINTETGELNKQIGVVYDAINAYKELLFVKASEKKAGAAAESLIDLEDQKRKLEAELKPYEKIMAQYKKYKMDQQMMALGGKPAGGKSTPFPDISQQELDKYNKIASQYNAILEQIKLAEQQINESFEMSEEYTKKYGATPNKPATTTVPPPLVTDSDKAKKDAEKARKEATQKAFDDLKFQLDMEYITEAEYYKKLAALRDKYFKKGSQEWQQYTAEIKKHTDKAREDAIKAEEDKYKERRQGSDKWIADQKYYGKLSTDEEIAAYERIKKYVKEYYAEGIIDKKEYQAEMSELDKDIYAARKTALEEEIKSAADAQRKILDSRKKAIEEEEKADKKSFDSRKKAIEDYYDLLDRKDKQTERNTKLSELQEMEKLYQNAATVEGKDKLRQIREEIRSLKNEAAKEERDIERKSKLEDLEKEQERAEEDRVRRLEALGKEYESLDTQQQILLKNISKYASLTAGTLEEATNKVKALIEAVNKFEITNPLSLGKGPINQSTYNLYQTNNNNIADQTSANIFGSYLSSGFMRFLPGVR